MNPLMVPDGGGTKRPGVLHWSSYVLWVVALIAWVGGPWALSLLTPRSGWATGSPSFWNLLGLIPVVAGIAGLLWTMGLHFAQAPDGMEWKLAQSYLLQHGPYAFTRHPMYLSELTLMLGWAVFYGSVAVLAGFLLALAMLGFVNMPLEERALEARFGETYLDYKRRVPRWPGTRRSRTH